MKPARVVVAALVAVTLVGVGLWLKAAQARQVDELEYAAQWDLEHGQADQAVTKLKALAKTHPDRPGVQRTLGRALTSTGAAAEALPILTAAASANPRDAEALEYQAVALAQLGRHAEAKQSLTRALEADDGRVSAWRRLGQVCLATSDVKAAAAAWTEAAKRAGPDRRVVLDEARTLLTAAGHVELAAPFDEPR